MYKFQMQQRKGAAAPLMAILSVLVLAMVAFAVDIGWIVLAKNQLQNAADAAALAGSDALMDGYVLFNIGTNDNQKTGIVKTYLTTSAGLAKQYAKNNMAGGVQNLVLRDEDIEYGIMDANNNYTALASYDTIINKGDVSAVLAKGFPNTIKVTMRRDELANGSLGLFFAQVIGTGQIALTTPASATIYGGKIISFSSNPPSNVHMLPMTYDVNNWNNFVATGQDPEGNMNIGPYGVPQLQVYSSVKDTGNFGELALDGAHAGTSEIRDWINFGLGGGDITALKNFGLLPIQDNGWNWVGNPGFRSSTIMDVNQLTGGIFTLPLFKPYATGTQSAGIRPSQNLNYLSRPGLNKQLLQFVGWGMNDDDPAYNDTNLQFVNNGNPNGNNNSSTYQAGTGDGSHYYYNILRFVGIRITSEGGDNRAIFVQPAAYVDPFAQFESVAPPTTGNTLVTTFTTPRLSR